MCIQSCSILFGETVSCSTGHSVKPVIIFCGPGDEALQSLQCSKTMSSLSVENGTRMYWENPTFIGEYSPLFLINQPSFSVLSHDLPIAWWLANRDENLSSTASCFAGPIQWCLYILYLSGLTIANKKIIYYVENQWKSFIRRPWPSPRPGRRLGPPEVWILSFLNLCHAVDPVFLAPFATPTL